MSNGFLIELGAMSMLRLLAGAEVGVFKFTILLPDEGGVLVSNGSKPTSE